ncbi:MAG: hypothetical protein FJX55_21365 [Alphaproteobacteria bacterium]|nr:hypothetical protein [Alphaproteobacteria bacterium]
MSVADRRTGAPVGGAAVRPPAEGRRGVPRRCGHARRTAAPRRGRADGDGRSVRGTVRAAAR